MNNENLAPLENGERAADNLEHKIAAEGISYDLKIESFLFDYEEVTSCYKNGEWVSFREWLQREEQKKKWTKDGHETSKRYLEGLFRTWGITEEFLICDINFLIRAVSYTHLTLPTNREV